MSTPQHPNDAENSQNPNDGQTAANAHSDHEGRPQPGNVRQPSDAYQQGGSYQQSGEAYSQHADAYSQPGAYQQGSAYQQQGVAYPQSGGYQSGGYPQQSGTGEKGFFKSLFDIRFDNFISVKWSGFIYIIAIVVAALSYLGTIIGAIVTSTAASSAAGYYSSGPSFSILPIILAIIFGWIIPALWVIFVRLCLELIVANIKTAENTRKIADSVGR